MTQIEFDMSVRAMKAEAHQEISAIEKLLTETKQEIANINLAMQPFCERIKVLKQKRNILSASLSEKRTEWGGQGARVLQRVLRQSHQQPCGSPNHQHHLRIAQTWV